MINLHDTACIRLECERITAQRKRDRSTKFLVLAMVLGFAVIVLFQVYGR